ncbi:MAG: tetratricopeptide repeat protein [Candidatus Binataceae bacterium]|nr:tetratricopeptide repeat protein [Candidatus Binataceae bacterium]
MTVKSRTRIIPSAALALILISAGAARSADSSATVTDAAGSKPANSPIAAAPPSVSSSAGVGDYGADSNAAKARALVAAAINMTDSDRAVKLLWQATTIDPSYADAYIYLALFYNSRSNFGKVVEVYQKLVKYQPGEVSAYLNIGEAYMSFQPPRMEDALPFYRKAISMDPTSSFAALRIGQIYAQEGNRGEAVKYLRIASGDRTKNPDLAAQADRLLHDMGS